MPARRNGVEAGLDAKSGERRAVGLASRVPGLGLTLAEGD